MKAIYPGTYILLSLRGSCKLKPPGVAVGILCVSRGFCWLVWFGFWSTWQVGGGDPRELNFTYFFHLEESLAFVHSPDPGGLACFILQSAP